MKHILCPIMIAGLLTLTLGTPAQAMRDVGYGNHGVPPVPGQGYQDGMNLYAGYFSMRGGLDPLGLWVVERDGMSKAIASPEDNDTIETLAEYVGLNASEFQKWLNLTGEDLLLISGERKTLEELVASDMPCEDVEIPNIMVVLWMGNFLDSITTDINTQSSDLENEGFRVVRLSADVARDRSFGGIRVAPENFLYAMEIATERRLLHGILVDGHGRAGHIWDDSHAWKLTYQEISDKLSYRLGAVLLNVCNGGWCAEQNPQMTGEISQWYGPIWREGEDGEERIIEAGGRDLASENAVFFGLQEGLNPFTENVDVAGQFPGDTQGTRE